MAGSRWVITPLWFSGSWRSFSYSSSVYSCHLFLISSTSVIAFCCTILHTISVLYCAHLCRKCSLSISLIFLKRSLVFPILLFSEGFLFFPCYSLEFCIQMGICLLLLLSCSPLPFASLLFIDICKASSDNHFAFFHFFFFEMVLITASCTVSSVHSPLGTVSDLIPWICHFHCIIIRGYDDILYFCTPVIRKVIFAKIFLKMFSFSFFTTILY